MQDINEPIRVIIDGEGYWIRIKELKKQVYAMKIEIYKDVREIKSQ